MGHPVKVNFTTLNCQSIMNKTQKVLDYLETNAVDIAMFQETWMKRGDKSVDFEVLEYGYKILKTTRQSESNGGGMAILCKSHIEVQKFTPQFSLDIKIFEYLHFMQHTSKWWYHQAGKHLSSSLFL